MFSTAPVALVEVACIHTVSFVLKQGVSMRQPACMTRSSQTTSTRASASRPIARCARHLRHLLGVWLALLGLGLGATATAGPSATCTHMVATGNPEYPPYLWRDPADNSRLIGANADFVQLVAKEVGIPIEVKYAGPWGRVQEEIKLGHEDLIAGAFFTLPRLEYMDYLYPAFRDTRSVIWTRSNADLNYKKWSDLRGLQGVTVINNSFGEDFDRYAQHALKIESVPSLEQALKMLEVSRVNYLIYEEAPGLAYIARMNIAGLQQMSVPISNESLFLTLSHASPCNTGAMRGMLARAVYKLTKQNVMDELVRKNIELWRQQSK